MPTTCLAAAQPQSSAPPHLTVQSHHLYIPPSALAPGPYRRLDVQVKPRVAESELSVAPHGLIGQSWDGDHVAISGKRDVYPSSGEFTTNAMAEGAIEGVAADYLMPSRYATLFKYSRYGLDHARPRDVSKLSSHRQNASIHSGEAYADEVA